MGNLDLSKDKLRKSGLTLAIALWIKLTSVLGWINTRLIVLALFYLIFTPVGIVLKLFGKDLLEIKFDRKRPTYWNKKEIKPFKPQDYQRQF